MEAASLTASLAGVVLTWDARAEALFATPSEHAVGRPLHELLATSGGHVQVTVQRVDDPDPHLAVRASARVDSELVASAGHELRAPLNAIIGFTELMRAGRAGELSATQREYLGDVLTSARHLLRLINDILELAKTEPCVREAEPVPQLISAVRDVVRGLAAHKRHRVSIDVDPSVAQLRVDAKRVLYDLVSHAIRLAPPGGEIVIRAMAATNPAEVRLEVENVGGGSVFAAILPGARDGG